MQMGEMGGVTWIEKPKVLAHILDILTELAGVVEVWCEMVDSVKIRMETGIVMDG